MKASRIINAIGLIDDELISEATHIRSSKKNVWLKWGSVAACFAVMLMAIAVPMMIDSDDPTPPIDNEYIYESGYVYSVDEGAYSAYIGGKVITEDKIGNKIADVSVTAGWKNAAGEWASATENLRGEVYAINGVSNDVAVALKFIDKGEAITTTHYYVIMNPTADLTPVKDYIITPITPNDPTNEGAVEEGAVNEGAVNEGAVNEGAVEEGAIEKYYEYGINEGKFSAYIGGKVIAEDKVGSKIEAVAVTAGWKNSASEWISTESLNAEVYTIEGISEDIAVSLKFIDKGEAVTTTHYYVIMNPNADLSAVEDYIIAPIVPNNPGDEMVNE